MSFSLSGIGKLKNLLNSFTLFTFFVAASTVHGENNECFSNLAEKKLPEVPEVAKLIREPRIKQARFFKDGSLIVAVNHEQLEGTHDLRKTKFYRFSCVSPVTIHTSEIFAYHPSGRIMTAVSDFIFDDDAIFRVGYFCDSKYSPSPCYAGVEKMNMYSGVTEAFTKLEAGVVPKAIALAPKKRLLVAGAKGFKSKLISLSRDSDPLGQTMYDFPYLEEMGSFDFIKGYKGTYFTLVRSYTYGTQKGAELLQIDSNGSVLDPGVDGFGRLDLSALIYSTGVPAVDDLSVRPEDGFMVIAFLNQEDLNSERVVLGVESHGQATSNTYLHFKRSAQEVSQGVAVAISKNRKVYVSHAMAQDKRVELGLSTGGNLCNKFTPIANGRRGYADHVLALPAERVLQLGHDRNSIFLRVYSKEPSVNAPSC